MKHVKKYEGVGTKSKLDAQIANSKKMKNFVSGAYIVFLEDLYNWKKSEKVNHLVLCRILSIESTLKKSGWPETFKFDNYIQFKLINCENDFDDFDIINTESGNFALRYEDIKKIYKITTSLKDAEEKFEEIKEDFILTKSTKKFNL